MHRILERQLKKYVHAGFDLRDISELLNAVSESYTFYDKSQDLIERAMFISSAELVQGNEKLRMDAQEEKIILANLNAIIETFQSDKERDSVGPRSKQTNELVEEISKLVEKQRSHENEMQDLLNSLKIANKELDSFAHIISHDLKAPLRGIASIVSWLSEDYHDKFDKDGQEQVELLKQRSKKMYDLIEGVLAYSRIGKSSGKIGQMDLGIFLNSEVIPLLVVPPHIEMLIADLPEISGDEYLIKQLFLNLLDNAIKFCDKEQGTIEIGYADKKSHWEFWVKDNGIGILEKYHKKIFQIFQTLSQSESGTGIGLAQVKKIVQNARGECRLESEADIGTTFYFTWPK